MTRVGDQEVARTQIGLDVREVLVFDDVRRDVEKTRCGAVRKRILSDELGRELEIKVGEKLFLHGLTGQRS